jgi:acyl-CoA synthetase (NDP forming)
MPSSFINEAVCYGLLEKYGIKTPRSIWLTATDASTASFKPGEDIVLKAVVDEVWHKSDMGLLEFSTFSAENISRALRIFQKRNPHQENWQGMLVCEKVALASSSLPTEILLSIRQDSSCGPVATFGFGGIHTELWGRELKNGVLTFPTKMTGVQDALDAISEHFLGKILLGTLRQGKALISAETLKKLLHAVWDLAAHFHDENLALLEINPLVVDITGDFIALDAVGKKADELTTSSGTWREKAPTPLPNAALFRPHTFIIAGVSSRKKAFGNLILDNLGESTIPRENIRVLKPDSNGFADYKTIASLAAIETPVDVLILAVPAQAAIGLIEAACKTAAARLIYLVSGGIGDNADHGNLKQQLLNILAAYPLDRRPRVIGPNSLGIILAPQKVNTLFIPTDKLPVSFYPHGTIGFIAQSGAFFITRISRNPSLPIRYGFCIGNQLDISATEILQSMATQDGLDVIGLYLEGPPQGDALHLAQTIKRIGTHKKVIIYRGGRSHAGMTAAAGHTGALASEYGIEKELLQHAGAVVCENFTRFENSLSWYSAYPDFSKSAVPNIFIMTNAGYESVACADGLGERLAPLSAKLRRQINTTLDHYHLSGIVSAANPLDLTPMASDDAYFSCAEDILHSEESGLLIIGIVPLAPMIDTDDDARITIHAQRLKQLIDASAKPVAVVVDAGTRYLKFKCAFMQANIPVFASVQEIFELIR